MKPITRVIAVQERCTGNSSVGSMWFDTKSFDANTPVGEIVRWARFSSGGEGKLTISIDAEDLPT